ncbi:MAG: sodium:solute symporter, partial [Paraglaciecola chathamensis]
AVQKDDPSICPNQEFKRDALNVLIGIVWHTSLTAAPIFLVIQHWGGLTIATAVAIISSILLKYMWWDTLSDEPHEQKISSQPSMFSPAQQGK